MNNKKTRPEVIAERTSVLGFSLKDDGKTHINVYSRGHTELGQQLSHFCYSQFTHPYFGPFYSIEGLWYFLRGGKQNDDLRYLYGRRAKDTGRKQRLVWYPEIREDILGANYQKIIQNRELLAAVKNSDLPFDHYYVYRTPTGQSYLINPKDSQWLAEGLEEIRKAIKADEVPACWISAEERYKRG